MNDFSPRVRSLALATITLVLPNAVSQSRAQTTPATAAEIVLTIDPTQSRVHFSVDSTLHTVHGTFALKSGTVHFDAETGNAGGDIIVIATSGESGNGSRDKRMHKEILETEKYPEVVFHPAHIEGKVSPNGASDVKLAGTMSIHGADHALTATVHADLKGDHWTGSATFDVPYIQWGIKDPSNFLLKVQPVVNVVLELSGPIQPSK
ncbi:MAG TPA: YceI family protein [Terriglobales bacterium]|nr:YceI family protein [Terriglobales bacterium]